MTKSLILRLNPSNFTFKMTNCLTGPNLNKYLIFLNNKKYISDLIFMVVIRGK